MPEIVRIDRLRPNASNARRHSPANLSAIETAIREVGPARSIVIDESNNILAGEATVIAAMRAGVTNVRAVDAKPREIVAVRRGGLTEAQKVRLGLHDNRAAERASWSSTALRQLAEDDADLVGIFTPAELAKEIRSFEGVPLGAALPHEHTVKVLCDTASERREVARRLALMGFVCR